MLQSKESRYIDPPSIESPLAPVQSPAPMSLKTKTSPSPQKAISVLLTLPPRIGPQQAGRPGTLSHPANGLGAVDTEAPGRPAKTSSPDTGRTKQSSFRFASQSKNARNSGSLSFAPAPSVSTKSRSS